MESLSRDSKLRETGEVDSLSLAEFYRELEDCYGIVIPDRLCALFNTIGEVVDYIETETAQ